MKVTMKIKLNRCLSMFWQCHILSLRLFGMHPQMFPTRFVFNGSCTVKIAYWVIRTSYNICHRNFVCKRLHKIPVKINFSVIWHVMASARREKNSAFIMKMGICPVGNFFLDHCSGESLD